MTLPSDDTIVLLHNPRCSKSRATLALLEERNVAFVERRYLEEPLSIEELEDLGKRLARPVREWMRNKEEAFARAGLDAATTDSRLMAAMAEHPVLMERPILVRGGRAIVGRPPEDVLGLLD